MRKAKRMKYRAFAKQLRSSEFWDNFYLEKQMKEDYFRSYEEERLDYIDRFP